MNRVQLDQIISVVEASISPAGFECVEAEWLANEKILRLYVDRADSGVRSEPISSTDSTSVSANVSANESVSDSATDKARGIDLEGCAQASRLLAEIPDLDSLILGSYTLEVSSPGLERPLRRRSHFEKVVGATVQVKLQSKILDRKNGTGRLVGVSGNEVTLETTQGPWSFPIDQVQKASLVYSWNNQ